MALEFYYRLNLSFKSNLETYSSDYPSLATWLNEEAETLCNA
jgi:hypothetical protein